MQQHRICVDFYIALTTLHLYIVERKLFYPTAEKYILYIFIHHEW